MLQLCVAVKATVLQNYSKKKKKKKRRFSLEFYSPLKKGTHLLLP